MAAFLHTETGQWSPGEMAIHSLLRVPTLAFNPTVHGLSPPHARRVQAAPLLAVGALDRATGQPWTSIWGGGGSSTAGQIMPNVLGIKSVVDRGFDPVVRALLGPDSVGADGVYRAGAPGGEAGRPMSALSLDLRRRDRVKLAGRLVAGAVTDADADPGVGDVQLAMVVRESLGNCPKYINKREVRPHVPRPTLVSDSLPLPPGAVALLGKADTFFLTSSDGAGGMDTNIRGGSPGLLRVVRNDGGGGKEGGSTATATLMYPEFSGNRFYQTLGNLHADPRVGIAVPDFDTGDVLYLTGRTTLLVGADASRLMPRARLAVRIDVDVARFVRDGLPFRGGAVDYSPYNPPVRRLASEMASAAAALAGQQKQQEAEDEEVAAAVGTATLTRREVLSPSVARLTFSLGRQQQAGKGDRRRPPPLRWRAGQHVTLDFGPELDLGWSHMREDDPQGLNDDFVRTFTVSSAPTVGGGGADGDGGGEEEAEMQITVRRHGPATALLWRWNVRVPLELPVLAFGGEEGFRIPVAVGAAGGEGARTTTAAVFVAGGVGITPLLAQARPLLEGKGLRVLWSIRAEDLPFALDSFRRLPGLGLVTRLFVTGELGERGENLAREVQGLGAGVARRRMLQSDLVLQGNGVNGSAGMRRRYYVCTGPEMLEAVISWLDGEDVVTESFQY